MRGVIFMTKKEPKPIKARKIKNIAATLKNMNKTENPADVLGSYTGMTSQNEPPVQDADDL